MIPDPLDAYYASIHRAPVPDLPPPDRRAINGWWPAIGLVAGIALASIAMRSPQPPPASQTQDVVRAIVQGQLRTAPVLEPRASRPPREAST